VKKALEYVNLIRNNYLGKSTESGKFTAVNKFKMPEKFMNLS